MQINLFIAYKSIEIALKYTKMIKSKKRRHKRVKNLTLEWKQK